MKCDRCKRRFRNPAAYELYQRRIAILDSLRNGTPCAHLASIELDRTKRHRKEHNEFRLYGEKAA